MVIQVCGAVLERVRLGTVGGVVPGQGKHNRATAWSATMEVFPDPDTATARTSIGERVAAIVSRII